MIQDITDILNGGNLDKFIGLREDLHLEAKSAAGDLVADPAARYELAKDVSALANAQGGYLIIGLRTEREPGKEEDVIKEVTPIEQADFPLERYKGVIDTHVHPKIEGLNVSWTPVGPDTRGLGVILVPEQHLDHKPFLISKVVNDGALLKEIVVGYAERFDSGNEPLTRDRLRKQLKKGRDSDSQRLTRIEEALDEIRAAMATTKKKTASPRPRRRPGDALELPPVAGAPQLALPPEEKVPELDRATLEARIEAIASDAPAGQPYYILAAAIPRGNRVLRFRTEGSESAKRMLFDAGRLREAGFDLTIGAITEPGPDGSWEARQGERKILRLYQDGMVLFGAAADNTFLGWGQDEDAFRSHPRLNPVAAVEIHASFAAFTRDLLARLEHPPDVVLFRLSLRNPRIGNEYLYLTEHLRGHHFIVDLLRHPIEKNPSDEELILAAEELAQHPMAAAAKLARQFYSMFDYRDNVPFMTITDGRAEIDIAKMNLR